MLKGWGPVMRTIRLSHISLGSHYYILTKLYYHQQKTNPVHKLEP